MFAFLKKFFCPPAKPVPTKSAILDKRENAPVECPKTLVVPEQTIENKSPEMVFRKIALPLVLIFEGQYTDNPKDYGGRTMKGILQREYNKYLEKKGLPSRHVKFILDEEVEEIYFKDYWLASKCDLMPETLAVCVFDTSVNNGQGQSIKILQKSIGAKVDGIIGPETLSKIPLSDPIQVANTFMDFRVKKYQNIVEADPTQMEFLDGWLRRASMLRAFINGTKTIEQIRIEW